MRIEELTSGCSITMVINVSEEQQLAFESRITDVMPKKRKVLAEAVIHDGKVLSFRSSGITVDVIATISTDEKPILFKNVTVEPVRLEDSYGYNLSAQKEGIPYNRRENFRCFVGLRTMLKTGIGMLEYEAVIRDVSATGFAIACDPNIELANNQLIHVLLEDYIEEIDENFSFHLYGFIVRKQEMESGKVIYGCRLNNHVGGLERYLTQKERIRIKKNRGR